MFLDQVMNENVLQAAFKFR
jgi:hypothetical protein